MSQSGVIMEFVHRRRRGAELFLLVLALAVGVGAYAAVGLGVEGRCRPTSSAYGGWLAALVVVAHVVVRFVAPYADPVLLPVVAALNGLGLAVIHRLDLADGTTFARQQLTWMTLGRRAVRAHPAGAARPPASSSGSPTPAGWPRSSCSCCRWCPGIGTDHQRRAHLDPPRPVQLPARRGRQAAAGRHLRRLPRAAPRRAGARRPPGAVRRPAARPRPRARSC